MNLPLANYDVEQQQFESFLDPHRRQRILMFSGESGIGKTRLLQHFLERTPAELPALLIQMRGRETTVADIFNRLGRRIGWEHLSRFTGQVARLAQTPQEPDDPNWLVEIRQHLQAAINQADLSQREEHKILLTDAWFTDVQQRTTPLLLALDTFEQTSSELENWLSRQFLPWVAESEPVRVLVAGQTVPEPTSEWGYCCSYRQLQGVPEAQAWLPVAQAMGKQVASLDYLAGVCAALRGNPGQILDFIRLLPDSEIQQQPPSTLAARRGQWRQMIIEAFELSEMKDICFDLGIDDENLSQDDTKSEFVLSLLKYLEKRGRLAELIELCRQQRPHLVW